MIRLLEFHRSSNCAKVRIALNYKGIPFETEEMTAADRGPLLRTANWPLVPVIVDGDVVMRDSEAILHYLESNYRQQPSLTPATPEEIRRGEAVRDEMQQRLRPLMRRLFIEAMKEPDRRDAGALEGIVEELQAVVELLEGKLEGNAFLLGERMSIYDVVLACGLMPARPRPDYAAQSPIWAFFQDHLSIPDRFRNVNRWMDRVLAFDGDGAGAPVRDERAEQRV